MSNSVIVSHGDNGFGVRLVAEGFTSEELLKLSESVAHMADALGSKQFEEFCTNFEYEEVTYTGMLWWKKYTRHTRPFFRYNNGLSREQIYIKMMLGSEILQEGDDREANINLKIDRRNKRSVLGYTYPNTITQWVYNYFFQNGTAEEVAGNLAHEWCHKLGFDHEYRYNPLRDKTVPYAVGYFVANYKKDLTYKEIMAKIYS